MSTQLSLKQYLDQPAVKSRVEQLLKERASQFMVTLSAMVNSDAKLAACEPNSLFTAALTIVALDLPVNNNLGFAWIIPYKDNKSGNTYAQAQLGYKAFIQLAMRSGQFKTLNVTDVREGEMKGNNRLTGEIEFEWIEIEADREKSKVVGYIAYFELLNGFKKSLYMSLQEINKHATRYSKTFKFGPWQDNFEAMARKTVIKLLLSRYAPMNTEMADAQEIDQAVVVDEETKYLDNQKETAQEAAEEKERQRIVKHIEDAKTIEFLEKCKDACSSDELKALYEKKEAELSSTEHVDADEVINGMEAANGFVS